MITGTWLAPRYPNKVVFLKDFSKLDSKSLSVYCPGCRGVMRITRSAPNGKTGGWCDKCGRAVAP